MYNKIIANKEDRLKEYNRLVKDKVDKNGY